MNKLQLLLVLCIASSVTAAAPKLTPKDFRVLPFCGTLSSQKLDPKQKGIFDELKVTTSGRIRIHGKKEDDTGRVGAGVHYHLGKLVLAPAGDRTGTLSAKEPSSNDAITYFIVLEVGDTLKSKSMTLEKGIQYVWALKTEGPNTKLSVSSGGTEVASVVVPAASVTGFGFAATARWTGNEADLAVEFDVMDEKR